MKTIKLLTALCFTLAFANTNAQDNPDDSHTIGITIPAVAILDIESIADKDLIMGFTHSGEAGDPITPTGNNTDLWLNYSYIPSILSSSKKAKIDVILSALIPGVDIKVVAGDASANGGGQKGSPTTILTLDNTTNKIIIETIGASYTDTGSSVGHQLTYSLVAAGSSTYQNLIEVAAASNETTVTYTITED